MDDTHWVFGYGSLIWKQDFPFLDARLGWIDGWSRRLWQGSHDHRGTALAPGRVATLIRAPGARCYGRALRIEHEVFEHLDHREKNGYVRQALDIHFDAGTSARGTTYIGLPGNIAYLGDAPLDEIVAQVHRSSGPSGSNADYVSKLAQALDALGIDDPHIRSIANALRPLLSQ